MEAAFSEQVRQQYCPPGPSRRSSYIGEELEQRREPYPWSFGRSTSESAFLEALRVRRTVISMQVDAEGARPRLPQPGSRLADVPAIFIRDLPVAADVNGGQLAKNAEAIALLERWLSEAPSQSENMNLEQTKRSLDEHRESPRRLFP